MACKRPINFMSAVASLFRMPYIQGGYVRGLQVNDPGVSHIDYGLNTFQLKPSPTPVNSLQVLASFEGIPRARGLQQSNNAYANELENYMFIAGIAEKSQG